MSELMEKVAQWLNTKFSDKEGDKVEYLLYLDKYTNKFSYNSFITIMDKVIYRLSLFRLLNPASNVLMLMHSSFIYSDLSINDIYAINNIDLEFYDLLEECDNESIIPKMKLFTSLIRDDLMKRFAIIKEFIAKCNINVDNLQQIWSLLDVSTLPELKSLMSKYYDEQLSNFNIMLSIQDLNVRAVDDFFGFVLSIALNNYDINRFNKIIMRIDNAVSEINNSIALSHAYFIEQENKLSASFNGKLEALMVQLASSSVSILSYSAELSQLSVNVDDKESQLLKILQQLDVMMVSMSDAASKLNVLLEQEFELMKQNQTGLVNIAELLNSTNSLGSNVVKLSAVLNIIDRVLPNSKVDKQVEDTINGVDNDIPYKNKRIIQEG